jgi:hypothetical protein
MTVALVVFVEHAASGLVWGAEVPVPPDPTIHKEDLFSSPSPIR